MLKRTELLCDAVVTVEARGHRTPLKETVYRAQDRHHHLTQVGESTHSLVDLAQKGGWDKTLKLPWAGLER